MRRPVVLGAAEVAASPALAAASTLVSTISTTCLAALLIASKAELDAAKADFTMATMPSEPAGAVLDISLMLADIALLTSAKLVSGTKAKKREAVASLVSVGHPT